MMGRLPDDLALEIELLSFPLENRSNPCSVPTCRPPSAPYAGWPLDLLRARRTKNASGIAPIAEGLLTPPPADESAQVRPKRAICRAVENKLCVVVAWGDG